MPRITLLKAYQYHSNKRPTDDDVFQYGSVMLCCKISLHDSGRCDRAKKRKKIAVDLFIKLIESIKGHNKRT